MTETEVMEIMDFVYRYHGAGLGFPTSVRHQPSTGVDSGPHIPEGWIEFVPRSGGAVLERGDMVWTDTGAEFNHYSADMQRAAPLDGKFTAEQRRLYTIALDVQKTVIGMVRPGVTWWELHDKAIEMLREAGGYDKDYYYGIGHFIGMEVHDEGDYLMPLQAGMVLSIEQGVMKPGAFDSFIDARGARKDSALTGYSCRLLLLAVSHSLESAARRSSLEYRR